MFESEFKDKDVTLLLNHSVRRGLLVTLLPLSLPIFAETSYTLKAVDSGNSGYAYTDNIRFSAAGHLLGESRPEPVGRVLGSTAWQFDGERVSQIGLMGAPYTLASGETHSFLPRSSESLFDMLPFKLPTSSTADGKVAGYNLRPLNNEASGLRVAWLFDGTETRALGEATDAFYPDAIVGSRVFLSMNPAGTVVGYSDLRLPTDPDARLPAGRFLWRELDGQAEPIGLHDAAHLNPNGIPMTYVNAFVPFEKRMNRHGDVIGESTRFVANGNQLPRDVGYAGMSAWLHQNDRSERLGLFDALHTATNGAQTSLPLALNDDGTVVGQSFQYTGNTISGYSVWQYAAGKTSVLTVPTDHPEATNSESTQSLAVYDLNAKGDVTLVRMEQADAWDLISAEPWLITGDNAVKLQLEGPTFTGPDGQQQGEPSLLNAAGDVAGVQYWYPVDASQSYKTAWLYRDGALREVGLKDQYRFNSVRRLNSAGDVIGISSDVELYQLEDSALNALNDARFDGFLQPRGMMPYLETEVAAIWHDNGSVTTAIKMRGDGFDCDGSRSLQLQDFNDGGFAHGTAKYCRENSEGVVTASRTTAWVYNATNKTTTDLTLSRDGFGQGSTQVKAVTDDGMAVGSYTLFDADGVEVGERAFLFTQTEGVQDLEALVGAEALTDAGIEHLLQATAISESGAIGGQAEISDGRIVAFLLTPEVEPEPDTSRWAWLRPLLGERLYQIVLAWLIGRD